MLRAAYTQIQFNNNDKKNLQPQLKAQRTCHFYSQTKISYDYCLKVKIKKLVFQS